MPINLADLLVGRAAVDALTRNRGHNQAMRRVGCAHRGRLVAQIVRSKNR